MDLKKFSCDYLPSLEFSRDQAKNWRVSYPFHWVACIKFWLGTQRRKRKVGKQMEEQMEKQLEEEMKECETQSEQCRKRMDGLL